MKYRMKPQIKASAIAALALISAGASSASAAIISTATFTNAGTAAVAGGGSVWKNVSDTTDLTATTVSSKVVQDHVNAVLGAAIATGDNDALRLRRAGEITTIDAMTLTTLGAKTVTIDWNWATGATATSVDLYYSADTTVGSDVKLDTNSGTNSVWAADSVTITGGVGGITFTDTARFYFTMPTGVNSNNMIFDNIEISYTVPEPSTALLGGLGALLLLRRRRI